MKEFTDLEMNLHQIRLTNSVSIADYVLTYNNGTMPGTQSELDAVLEKIPEGTKKQYLNGKNEAVIQLYTSRMETQAKSDLKDQINGTSPCIRHHLVCRHVLPAV